LPRVPVQPRLLEWACDRAGYDVGSFVEAHPRIRLREWLAGARQPTLKQLEDFARRTRTPIGCFFLSEPPEEPVPIPDFRTLAGRGIDRPSPDLLDTIYLCERRQDWYREFARTEGEPVRDFVESVTLDDEPVTVAGRMRDALGFSVEERHDLQSWSEALRRFVEQVEEIGALVMVSGVVGANNTRRLDPAEFRGFALSDPLAPLVFVNGADTRSARMFTLAHELAHLWLGTSALSDATMRERPSRTAEKWCNAVAAELLVPLASLREHHRDAETTPDEVGRLARVFKVSTLVILFRLRDAGRLSRDAFRRAYDAEVERLRHVDATSAGGGEFYQTTIARVSRRFARALISSTMEGGASFTEAGRLLGIRKASTFDELGRAVGVAV